MVTNEAIILAGGLGLRLKGSIPDIPKCMAPVNGKPFLTYVLDYLERQNVNKVILSVGYRKDHIINYFCNNYRSIEIICSVEDEPLGTGGALKAALNYCQQENVFVLNGDTYFIPDLKEMEYLHANASADITIAVVHVQDSSRYGLVISDKLNRITEFSEKEKASGTGWINGGIYLVRKQIFDFFDKQKFSLENELFKTACSTLHLQAFHTDAFFLDIGIPEDYARAQSLIIEQVR